MYSTNAVYRVGRYESDTSVPASSDRNPRPTASVTGFVASECKAVHMPVIEIPQASPEAIEKYESERAAYWRMRDELVPDYLGKWVAIVDGKVAAISDQLSKVADAVVRATGRTTMYVGFVGREDHVLRVRLGSKRSDATQSHAA